MSDNNNQIYTILLDIKETQGKQSAELSSQSKKLVSIEKQVKYTNGRVTKNETIISDLLESIKELTKKTKVVIEHPDKVKVVKNTIFKMTWEKVMILITSLATIFALIIEKLS